MRSMVRGLRSAVRGVAAGAACVALCATVGLTGTAHAAEVSDEQAAGAKPAFPSEIKGWQPIGRYEIDAASQAQGLANVRPPGAEPYLYYTGNTSIPAPVRERGWSHIGDPDSSRGYLFDAYQGGGDATAKMFRVTTPSGAAYEYVHPLAAGEAMNNSFAAISPDSRWMVSGEWDTMNRLLVFPTPLLNPATARTGGDLALAGTIELDRPVKDIQGCTFLDAKRLLCASDDSDRKLFPEAKPLLQIELKKALNGRTVTGHVTSLGALPQLSACPGTAVDFETEGNDYDRRTGVLRVEMIPPRDCAARATVYEFKRKH
ncbi:hypothetical protein ACFRCG_21305 [Embleya sp. NPDC056575]|uniref:hypothetical protein n=1 Tax=unclassified Embleya TaxID=2699296 RepID=UPI0036A6BA1B